jgi:hypothetical protein
MTDLDDLLRAADPAAGLTPPEPGEPPLDRPLSLRPSRRPTRWLPAVAAAAAVLLVVGVVATGLGRDRSAGPAGTVITSAPPSAPATSPPVSPSPSPPQVTAAVTATSAADKARAQRLLADLRAAVRDRYGIPTGSLRAGYQGALTAAYDVQAQAFPAEPVTTTRYQVDQMVTAGREIGQLGAVVIPGVPAWTDDPCALFQRLDFGIYETCGVVTTTTGARVAVGGWAASPGRAVSAMRFAAYRGPDGTFVLLTESRGTDPAVPALPTMPLTDVQLAALAADPAFGR